MATLILARHGRTTANVTGVLAGRSKGVHLDDTGREQARVAAARLTGVPLAAVVTSPLERCRETAREIVRREGFKELSMRALARAVGVTAPTLYDYFPSKEAVLDALYVVGVNAMIDDYDRILAETSSGLDAMAQMARAYREFAIGQQDVFLLIFGRVDSTYFPGEEECVECRCRAEAA